jgi:hypothetical protein
MSQFETGPAPLDVNPCYIRTYDDGLKLSGVNVAANKFRNLLIAGLTVCDSVV